MEKRNLATPADTTYPPPYISVDWEVLDDPDGIQDSAYVSVGAEEFVKLFSEALKGETRKGGLIMEKEKRQ